MTWDDMLALSLRIARDLDGTPYETPIFKAVSDGSDTFSRLDVHLTDGTHIVSLPNEAAYNRLLDNNRRLLNWQLSQAKRRSVSGEEYAR
jgi:hypothetical protein